MSLELKHSEMKCIVKKCDQKRHYKIPNENFVIKILFFRFPTDKEKYKNLII